MSRRTWRTASLAILLGGCGPLLGIHDVKMAPEPPDPGHFVERGGRSYYAFEDGAEFALEALAPIPAGDLGLQDLPALCTQYASVTPTTETQILLPFQSPTTEQVGRSGWAHAVVGSIESLYARVCAANPGAAHCSEIWDGAHNTLRLSVYYLEHLAAVTNDRRPARQGMDPACPTLSNGLISGSTLQDLGGDLSQDYAQLTRWYPLPPAAVVGEEPSFAEREQVAAAVLPGTSLWSEAAPASCGAESLALTQRQVDLYEFSGLHIPKEARAQAQYGADAMTCFNVERQPDGRGKVCNLDVVDHLKRLLGSPTAAHEVIAALDLRWSCRTTGDDSSHETWCDYDPSAPQGRRGQHLLLTGYSDAWSPPGAQSGAPGYFSFKVSWGERFGAGRVSYETVDRALASGCVVLWLRNLGWAPDARYSRWIGPWSYDADGSSRGEVVLRRPHALDTHVGDAGTLTPNGGASQPLPVAEVTLAADGSTFGFKPPGGTASLRYVPWTRPSDPASELPYDYATGTTNTTVSTVLIRPEVNPARGPAGTYSAQRWLGTWRLAPSDWTLEVTSVALPNFTATLRQLDGSASVIAGTIAGRTLTFDKIVLLSTWAYTLTYHDGETRFASGTQTIERTVPTPSSVTTGAYAWQP